MDARDARKLERYTSLEYILLGDLRDILEERPDDESRRWLLAVSDHDVGWVDGRPVRLLWFARETEFWSTELYLPGDVREFPDEVLVEHLDRAQEGWYQGVGSADPLR